MGGETIESAALTYQGIPGDREYAFVQSASRSSFPWLTGRQAPGMLHYSAALGGEGSTRVTVRSPAGVSRPIDSPELLAELEEAAGMGVTLLANHRGNYDVAPVSLISLATVRALARESGTAFDPLRFRMTVYVDTGEDEPFTENRWVGRELAIGGEAHVAVTEPDKRCAMITLDYPASRGSADVLRAAAQLNSGCAGVYAVVVRAGEVRTGDKVCLA